MAATTGPRLEDLLEELWERGAVPEDEVKKKYGGMLQDAISGGYVYFDANRRMYALTNYGRDFLENRILGPRRVAERVIEHIRATLGDGVECYVDDPNTRVIVRVATEEQYRLAMMYLNDWMSEMPGNWRIVVEAPDEYAVEVRSYWDIKVGGAGLYSFVGQVVSVASDVVETNQGIYRTVVLMEPESYYGYNGREPFKVTVLLDRNTDRVQVGELVKVVGLKIEGRVARNLANVVIARNVSRINTIEEWVRSHPEEYRRMRDAIYALIYKNGRRDPANIRWREHRIRILGAEKVIRVPEIMERLANMLSVGVALPRPALHILSLLMVPASGISVFFVGDLGVGKNTAAATLARYMELGGLRCHVYRCERASVANVFGGVYESGSRVLSRGSIMLYDFVVFDEFHFAPKPLRSKMREYLGEHTVTIDLMAGNRPLQSVQYPAWMPCLILSNDKNGDNIEKMRISGEAVTPVSMSDVLRRLETGPFIDRLTYAFLIIDSDVYFWREEVARRQEQWKIVKRANGEKAKVLQIPNEGLVEAWMKTLYYEMLKVEPEIDDEVERYISSVASRRKRDSIRLAALAIAKLCLSPRVTKEMVDLAVALREWGESTFDRTFHIYIDLEGNLVEMDENTRKEFEEKYMQETKTLAERKLRELESLYPAWVEQNGRFPTKRELAQIMGVKMSEVDARISMLYPHIIAVQHKNATRYLLVRDEVFDSFRHLLSELDRMALERIKDAYMKIYGRPPRTGPFAQLAMDEIGNEEGAEDSEVVKFECEDCGNTFWLPSEAEKRGARCNRCGSANVRRASGGGTDDGT